MSNRLTNVLQTHVKMEVDAGMELLAMFAAALKVTAEGNVKLR